MSTHSSALQLAATTRRRLLRPCHGQTSTASTRVRTSDKRSAIAVSQRLRGATASQPKHANLCEQGGPDACTPSPGPAGQASQRAGWPTTGPPLLALISVQTCFRPAAGTALQFYRLLGSGVCGSGNPVRALTCGERPQRLTSASRADWGQTRRVRRIAGSWARRVGPPTTLQEAACPHRGAAA